MARRSLREEVRQIIKKRNCTSIFVTHDPEEAIETADQIAVMESGVISQLGTAEDLYNNPASLLVGLMAGEGAVLNGRKMGGLVETSFGQFTMDRLSIKNEVQDGDDIRILLRPFTAQLTADTDGAIISDVRRTGQSHIVTLRDKAGKFLLLQVSPDSVLNVGQTVRLNVADKPVPAFTV